MSLACVRATVSWLSGQSLRQEGRRTSNYWCAIDFLLSCGGQRWAEARRKTRRSSVSAAASARCCEAPSLDAPVSAAIAYLSLPADRPQLLSRSVGHQLQKQLQQQQHWLLASAMPQRESMILQRRQSHCRFIRDPRRIKQKWGAVIQLERSFADGFLPRCPEVFAAMLSCRNLPVWKVNVSWYDFFLC